MEQPSTSSRPNLCAFIGRFEPLHSGHIRVIQQGLAQADYMVVLVGSANEPRSVRNPFTAQERIEMIQATFCNDQRLIVLPLEDSDYDVADWVDRARNTVEQAWALIRKRYPQAPQTPSVALIGHAKDATSFYLDLFPAWRSIDVPQAHPLSATSLRAEIFGDPKMIFPWLLEQEASQARFIQTDYLQAYASAAQARATTFLSSQRQELLSGECRAKISQSVLDFLDQFLRTDAFFDTCAEFAFVARNKFQWRHCPHPPIFQTADAIVLRAGRVLMIKRNSYPGKGLWALPGGYVEENEPVFEACLRELREETSLELADARVSAKMTASKRFDAPFRSARGRVITEAFVFRLTPGDSPKIKHGGREGDEETQAIEWREVKGLRRDECFEDHYSIVKNMLHEADSY